MHACIYMVIACICRQVASDLMEVEDWGLDGGA